MFFILAALQSLTICFASDVVTFQEVEKINNKIKKEVDTQVLSPELEGKGRIALQSLNGERDYVDSCLERYNQRAGVESSSSFYYDSSIFEGFLKEDNVAKDNKNPWFYYSAESALYQAKNKDFNAATTSFLQALEIIPEKVRYILSYMVTITVSKKLYNDDHASYRALANLYENIRVKTPTFTEYDAIDLINLGFLTYVGKDFEKSLKFLMKSLEKKWPDEKDQDFKIRIDKPNILRCIADILYDKENYEEFKKFVFRSDYLKSMEIDDYFHLAHISALEENWEAAGNYVEKVAFFLSQGQSIYIKNEEIALCLVEICCKSEKNKKLKNIFIDLLKDTIPPLREEITSLVKKLNKANFNVLRSTIVSYVYQQKVEKIQSMMGELDTIYQELWLKASLLPHLQGDSLLTSLDNYYEKFQESYNALDFDSSSGNKNFNQQYNNLIKISEDIKLLSRRIILENNIHYIKTNKQALPLQQDLVVLSANNSKKFLPHKTKSIENIVSYQPQTASSSTQKEGLGIQSFGNTQTQEIWESREAQTYSVRVLDLLDSLNSANSMFELSKKVSKGANLEKLQGGSGLLSLRINDQWRLCFKWISGKGAYDVAVVDYH